MREGNGVGRLGYLFRLVKQTENAARRGGGVLKLGGNGGDLVERFGKL